MNTREEQNSEEFTKDMDTFTKRRENGSGSKSAGRGVIVRGPRIHQVL
jgi:hypothetical protein